MSKLRDYITTCHECKARTYFSTNWMTGKMVETVHPCTCNARTESLLGVAPKNPCETPGCTKLARLRFCLTCSSERQADVERNRYGTKVTGPLPKCGWCNAQLTHPLAKTCRTCKKKLNAERHHINRQSAA
jgi:hypothetical protein